MGTRQQLAVLGAILLGAVGALSCCVLPVVLLSIGMSGAVLGTFATLAPYKSLFVAMSLGFLAYGLYVVYWKKRRACTANAQCAPSFWDPIVRFGLWTAAILLLLAVAFDYVEPLLLGP